MNLASKCTKHSTEKVRIKCFSHHTNHTKYDPLLKLRENYTLWPFNFDKLICKTIVEYQVCDIKHQNKNKVY